MVRRPRRLVPRRVPRHRALARRPRSRLPGRGGRLRDARRPRPAARVLRAHAAPHRGHRRRLLRTGPPPLLRLLGGDAHPALPPRRRVGRRGPAARDAALRHLHDGRLAADAGLDHRLRPRPGDVRPPRAGTAGQLDVAVPRLRGGVRREGAALPVPRLAAVRVPRGAGRGRGRPLRRRLEGGRVRLPLHRDRPLPRPGRRPAGAHPRPRRSRPRLRLAARVQGAGRARRHRVLEPRAAGPDHARALRDEPRRLERRAAPDGEPRPALDDAVHARRAHRVAGRDRAASTGSAAWPAAARRSRRCSW